MVEVLDAVDPDRKLFACAEIRRDCALFEGEPPEWATEGRCRIDLFMSEAERTLRDFLASKTLADLVCEFSRKAPPEFAAASGRWFQERRAGRTTRRGRSANDRARAAPQNTTEKEPPWRSPRSCARY